MGHVLFQLFIIASIALGSIYILYTVMFNKNMIQVINHRKQRNYIKEFYHMILEDSNIKIVVENIAVNGEKYFTEGHTRDEKNMVEMLRRECFDNNNHLEIDDEEILYLMKIANIFYKS